MFNHPKFEIEKVATSYIPKEKLLMQQRDGNYLLNQELLDMIPTPAVVEMVRDTKKWMMGGRNIKDLIGSELSISHMGLLYREHFKYGDLIYHKITCKFDNKSKKYCDVSPVICQKNNCNELMLVHATDAYPYGYYWYKKINGDYTCSSKPST